MKTKRWTLSVLTLLPHPPLAQSRYVSLLFISFIITFLCVYSYMVNGLVVVLFVFHPFFPVQCCFSLQILNPVTSATIVTSRERGSPGGLTNQGVRAAGLQNGRTPLSPTQAPSRTTTFTTTHPIKRATTITDETDYILPDSTMTEISLQVPQSALKFFIYFSFKWTLLLTLIIANPLFLDTVYFSQSL